MKKYFVYLIIFIFFSNTATAKDLENLMQAKRFISKIFAEALVNNINGYHESYTTGLSRGKRGNYLFIDKDHYQYCLTYEYQKFKCGEIDWLIGKQFINNFKFDDIDTNNDMKISLEELTNNFYNKKSKKINNPDYTEDYIKFFEVFNSINYKILTINLFDQKFAEYVEKFELSFDYGNNTVWNLIKEDYNADFKISLEDIKKWYFVTHFYTDGPSGYIENKKLLKDIEDVLQNNIKWSGDAAIRAINANKIIKITNSNGGITKKSCTELANEGSYYSGLPSFSAINYSNYLWNIHDKHCLEKRNFYEILENN